MKIVSVILARGGSKEIPSKNIIDLCGMPLISYAIKASILSNVSETWVSTNCSKIKAVSEKYGAMVLDRPDDISGDKCKSELALIHFVENIDCDILVFIQPTSPMINYKDINKGIYLIGKYDSVISVYKKHWLPSWGYKDGIFKPIGWNLEDRPMRQDVDIAYIENGAFYITTSHAIIETGIRSSGSVGFVEMSEIDSIQIDSHSNLELAETILSNKNGN